MQNFTHHIPTEILFGQGQIEHLTEVLDRYGKTVLLTYGGGSIKSIGLYDDVKARLAAGGFRVVECGGIDPNPRIDTVRRGAALAREHHADVVLAVGGGSTIDCSKAICTGALYEGDLWEMVMHPETIRGALPLVDILTLAATGSEFDPFSVISNPETRQKIGSPLTYPAVSICDPTYTYTVSAYQTAAGSADIMSHVMEVYFSDVADSEVSEGLCETLLKTVIRNLPIALREPDNYTARANLMYASSLACCGMPSYGKDVYAWSCHGMEHELSAYYDITHGVGLAILTPRWMEHILSPKTVGRFVRFAKNVFGLDGGDDLALARAGIAALSEFFRGCGIPMTLGEVGIDEAEFGNMARDAVLFGDLANAYVPLTEEDVTAIFRACL